MKLLLLLSLALGGNKTTEETASPDVDLFSPMLNEEAKDAVEQAAEMNEKLAEILVRVQQIQQVQDTVVVTSEPIKRIEPTKTTE